MSGFVEALRHGGWVIMGAIFVCSLFGLGIFLERLFRLRAAQREISDLSSRIRRMLQADQIDEAAVYLDGLDGPIAALYRAGVVRFSRPRAEIKDAIGDAGGAVMHALERRLSWLATIGTITPLLGLLGTVAGMVRIFRRIQIMGQVNAGDLAGGIYTALWTTVFGLCVAIPAFVFYNFLVGKVAELTADLEAGTLAILDISEARAGGKVSPGGAGDSEA